MKRQHSRLWLRLRVFFSCLLALLSISIVMRGEASYPFGNGDSTTPRAYAEQQNADLCAALKQAAGGEPLNLVPGVGQPGADYQCVTSLRNNAYLTLTNFGVEGSRGQVANEKGLSSWQPSALGDPGNGWESPAHFDPTNGWSSIYMIYARGCYFVQASGAKDPTTHKPSDTPPIPAIAAALDKTLQQPPYSACGGASQSGLDLTIDHMEVVQVVQTVDNKIPLVAGKKTVVRVFMKASGTALGGVASNVRASLFYWPEGKTEEEIKPSNGPLSIGVDAAPRREDTNGSINFVIPAEAAAPGVFSIKAVINPAHGVTESNYSNNELTRPFEFEQRNGLRVGYVRIGIKLPGQADYIWPSSNISQDDTLLKKIFPVPDVGFQYYELPWRMRVDGPLTYAGESGEILAEMREFYHRMEVGRPDIIVGWFPTGTKPDTAKYNPDFGGVGYLGMPAALAGDYSDTSYSNVALAHEVGHNLNLDHTGTPSVESPGCAASKRFSWDSGSVWPKEYGDSATIHEVGFDTQEMQAIPDNYYDFMSYCGPDRWVSPFHYKRLYDSGLRAPNALIVPGGKKLWVSGTLLEGKVAKFEIVASSNSKPGGSGEQKTAALSNPSDVYQLSLSGLAGSRLSLLNRSQSVPALREGTGGYCLRFMDASGTLLYERCFDPPTPHPPVTGVGIDKVGFTLEVPDPGKVARAVMVRTNGVQEEEVGSLTVSAHAPTLTISSPKAGDRWEGEHTIEWSGSDEDGDALRYDIMYSADGKQTWYPLEVGAHETAYTFSTEEILPGEQAYFRVTASDGYNTTGAEVGPLTVPQQANSPSPPPPPPAGSDAGNTSGSTGTGTGTGMERDQEQGGNNSTGGSKPPISKPLDQDLLLMIGAGVLAAVVALAIALFAWRLGRRPSVAGASAAVGTGVGAAVNPFQATEQEYWRLRNALAAGQISSQQYEANARQLVVQDARGYSWKLGTVDGLWYFYDGHAWVQANPYQGG